MLLRIASLTERRIGRCSTGTAIIGAHGVAAGNTDRVWTCGPPPVVPRPALASTEAT